MLEFRGQMRDVGPKMRVLKREGSGRFGPDEEIRLPRSWRTPQAELLEFRPVGFVLGVPIPDVQHILRKIGLNNTRDVAGRGCWDKTGSDNLYRKEDHNHSGYNGEPAFPLFRGTRQNPDEQRIESCYEEGNTINSGNR